MNPVESFCEAALLSASPAAPRPGPLRDAFWRHLRYTLAAEGNADDWFRALGYAVRERLIDRMQATEERYARQAAKRMYYLSLEFLVGRSMRSNLAALGLVAQAREALQSCGANLEDLLEAEPDPGLGNGGLGRLAACFLESLASLGMPGFGYGIQYEFGLFRQEIRNGAQREVPDHWFAARSPWMLERPAETVLVPLYGRIEHGVDRPGNYNPMWVDWRLIAGVPWDMPMAGYDGITANLLRLFAARAAGEFDMEIFNSGDYFRAVEQKVSSETVSKVLYPSDAVPQGKELRLVQEYFLVACAVRDLMSRHLRRHAGVASLADGVALQLNDTHPALAVAELMRVLVDEHGIGWEQAEDLTRAVCGYTNHTLMPEALERWPVSLMEYVLPRHLQIILEINHRFLGEVRSRWPGQEHRAARMSLIEEDPERQVRMAHLAIVGSHAVNGVSAMHSKLVAESLVPEFAALWPERFQNKTNGITHRRWLLEANPPLAQVITERIGDGWILHAGDLDRFAAYAGDRETRQAVSAAKFAAKARLSDWVGRSIGKPIDPRWMFDVHVKRIHEYKRQLLNVLGIIDEFLRIAEDGERPGVPRVCLFAGKAAPGYFMAKLIIRLIHGVASAIEQDPAAGQFLRVVFLPDYRVSLAELMIPAADLSEQISTAGTEASGTGNMKLALNGALTLGTLDGANVEMREAVGPENMYIFGVTAAEAGDQPGKYRPWEHYEADPRIRRVLDAIRGSRFSPQEPDLFHPIVAALLEQGDRYLHLIDFPSYIQARSEACRDFADASAWSGRAIRNIAGMAHFSSDRTVAEYARDIWNIRAPRR